MLVALVIIPFTFGTAIAFGFRGRGSLLLAMGVGMLLSLSAVGLGLLTACFARNDGEAANLSAVVGVMMVLVSGAMYPMPDIPLVTVAGRTLQFYDLLPPTHAAEALRRVLILGNTWKEIGYELAALSILSAVILAMGVALYQRLQLA
jgi:ABC-type polysaccharide/polyol phosphate export permease